MFAPSAFTRGIVAGANTPANIAKREREAARIAAIADKVEADKAQAAAAQAHAEANPFVPTIPEYFTDLESTSYVNPYYVGPQTGGYSRFDTDQVGAGIQNLQNPARSFDAIVASQFFNPVDLGGADSQAALAAYNLLGSGVVGERSPELQAGFDFNKTLDLNRQRYKNYFDEIPQARDFFRSQGIDLDSIKSLEDLDAIDSTLKGDVFGRFVDEQERAKQFENQKAKSGILDSLPGKIIGGGLLGLATGGVGLAAGLGPVGVGSLVGGVGGLASGNGLKGALIGAGLGGLTGYAGSKLFPGGFGSGGGGFTNPDALGLEPGHLYNPTSLGGAIPGPTGLGLNPSMFASGGASLGLNSFGSFPDALGYPGAYNNPWTGVTDNVGGGFTNPSALGTPYSNPAIGDALYNPASLPFPSGSTPSGIPGGTPSGIPGSNLPGVLGAAGDLLGTLGGGEAGGSVDFQQTGGSSFAAPYQRQPLPQAPGPMSYFDYNTDPFRGFI